MLKRFICLLFALILLLTVSSSVSFASDESSSGVGNTSWNKVLISQSEVGMPKGCTTCTFHLILQNSGLLKSEFQLSGRIATTSNAIFNKFNKFTDMSSNPDGYHSDFSLTCQNVSFFNKVCIDGSNWRLSADKSVGNSDANVATSWAIVGLGGKDFRNMSDSEVLTAIKTFYNNGYWLAISVIYEKRATHKSNGPQGYRGDHFVMLGGVAENDFFINDPAGGRITAFSKAMSSSEGRYKVMSVVPIKNDKCSPMSLAGGAVPINTSDQSNAASLGLTVEQVSGAGVINGVSGGYFTEDQLSAYCKLTETNIQDLYLDSATREGLDQDSLQGLAGWEKAVNNNKMEHGFIKTMRVAIMMFGILLILYAVFLYLAFWVDKINTIVDIEMLNLLTFGKLHVAGDEEPSTYSITKEGSKSVSHKDIIFICLTAIGFGILIITGSFYRIMAWLVNWALRLTKF